MVETKFKVEGLNALHELLREFPQRLQNNIVRNSVRAAAREYANEAKARVPIGDTGKLKKSIRISARIDKVKLLITAKVNAGGRKKDDPYYAYWVEYGTLPHSITAGSYNRHRQNVLLIKGRFVGKPVIHPGAKPKSFMRSAADSATPRALETFKNKLKTDIDKAVIGSVSAVEK
jgi:HK97 gp10 family phage protein